MPATVKIPTAEELISLRMRMDLTLDDMAEVIGYSPARGAETVRFLELGSRHSKPYEMSGPAALSLHRMNVLAEVFEAVQDGELATVLKILRRELPEKVIKAASTKKKTARVLSMRRGRAGAVTAGDEP